MNQLIPQRDFSSSGKLLVSAITSIFVLMWIFALFAYYNLPNVIPTHFDMKGKPDDFGDKSSFLLTTFVLSITPLIFIILVRYRFVLINRYPHLINLPGFFLYIEKIEYSRRAYWYNRYFEILLWLGLSISIYLFIIQLIVYNSTVSGEFNLLFLILIVVFPIFLIIPFLLVLSSLSKELKSEAEKNI